MEKWGIIIIDSCSSKITVMHSTHDQDELKETNIELALKRYEERAHSKESNYNWMEYEEPLTIHSL